MTLPMMKLYMAYVMRDTCKGLLITNVSNVRNQQNHCVLYVKTARLNHHIEDMTASMTEGCTFCHKPFMDSQDIPVSHDVCFDKHTKRFRDRRCVKCNSASLYSKTDIQCPTCENDDNALFLGYEGPEIV